MASSGPPTILAKCPCGEILIKDYPNDPDSYWTKNQTIVGLAKTKFNVSSVLCPACGGDCSVPIGNYFLPEKKHVQTSCNL